MEKRVIKFRAWTGSQMKYNVGFHPYQNFRLQDVLPEDPHPYKDGENMVYSSGLVELMQFTGRIDETGKEIYEGDWCEAQFRGNDGIQVIQGQIIMDEFMWCIDCTGCVGDDIFSINRPHAFKVIGNIYENPELLTGK